MGGKRLFQVKGEDTMQTEVRINIQPGEAGWDRLFQIRKSLGAKIHC
jgi:hypothetical protein